jgi:hypothetical protein
MPDLGFLIEGAEAVPFSMAPLLALKLRITCPQNGRLAAMSIHSVSLRCQIRIEPAKRTYVRAEQLDLLELFGEPRRWGQTQKSMLWTHSNVVVPAFSESTLVDLPVSCSYDFNLAATKYFDALEGGEVPLCLLFSGTIFYTEDDGPLQVAQIPWEKEASFRIPVRVWREMMDLYYPNTAWLCLRKDVFDRLARYKTENGLPTWEHALERLLPPAPSHEAS